MGTSSFGYCSNALHSMAKRLVQLRESGVQVGVVIGGGNLFRGLQNEISLKIDRSTTDQVGMLATLMNASLLSEVVARNGCPTKLLTPFSCPHLADEYRLDRALEGLEKGIVFFAGGTGHPYFTTDSAAALRAIQIKADLLVKLTTQVSGVYNTDPRRNPQATLYSEISYDDFLAQKLGVLDLTAVTLCMNHKIPIRVCNINEGSLIDALSGQFGTLITEN